MDDKRFSGTGKYLGINSVHGVGKNNARIFLQADNGHIVDGLVPIEQYKKLQRAQNYTLNLEKGNDPSPQKRAWV
jgi:hypothetical protein